MSVSVSMLHSPEAEMHSDSSPKYKYSPIIDIPAILVGCILSLECIPEEYAPRGALFLSGLLLSLGILFGPILRVLKNPRSVIRPENVLALIPVFWVLFDLVQGTFPLNSIERTDVTRALIAVALFSASICLGRWANPFKMPRIVMQTAAADLSEGSLFSLTVISFLLAMFRYAYPCDFDPTIMIYYIFQGRWMAPWGRGDLGGWDSFGDHLQYFGYLLPALTVILAIKGGWFRPKVCIAVLLSLIMSLFLSQGGGRRIVGVIIGVGLVVWVLGNRRHTIKSTTILLLVVVGLLFWMNQMLKYRNVGLGQMFSDGTEGVIQNGVPILDEGADKYQFKIDDNFLRLAQIIHLIPLESPFVYHRYIIFILVRPIPRVFWPGKPVGPGFDLPGAVGVTGASLSSSVIGELYMCAGFVGVCIGGLVFGNLAGMVSGILVGEMTPERALIYSLLVMALFAGGRSGIELMLMSYITLAWLAALKIYRILES